MTNILIVDDEALNVQAIREKCDWKSLLIDGVYEAYSAKQACDILQSQDIHIILCDIEMPEESGLDLLRQVKAHNLPVISIIITAHAIFHYSKEALELGCMEYLLKPIDYTLLNQVILRASKLSKKLREQQNYVTNWLSNRHLFINQFWKDVIYEEIEPSEEQILSAALQRGMDVSPEDTYLLVLFPNIDFWVQENGNHTTLKDNFSRIINTNIPDIVSIFNSKTAMVTTCLSRTVCLKSDHGKFLAVCETISDLFAHNNLAKIKIGFCENIALDILAYAGGKWGENFLIQ